MIGIVTGRLGQDPQVKSGESKGKPYSFLSFSVCENVFVNGKKDSVWFDVTTNQTGLEKVLGKGCVVTVIGEVTTREYNGKQQRQIRANSINVATFKEKDADKGDANEDTAPPF